MKKEKSQGKDAEVTVNSKEKTLKIETFVWILSKNSASGHDATALFRFHNALDIWTVALFFYIIKHRRVAVIFKQLNKFSLPAMQYLVR